MYWGSDGSVPPPEPKDKEFCHSRAQGNMGALGARRARSFGSLTPPWRRMNHCLVMTEIVVCLDKVHNLLFQPENPDMCPVRKQN
jgi:hypothetical protein